MKRVYDIPMIGITYTRTWSDPCIDDHYPLLRVEGSSFRQRFAVELRDDGLEGLDIHEGDYLVFVQSGWPTSEEAVCFIRQGDESIVRVMLGIYDTEPTLIVTGDRYADIELHRNQYQVSGQLVGVIRHGEAHFLEPEEATYDWGC